MKAAIIRRFSALLVCLMLTGCSLPTMLDMSAAEETELFAAGLDRYIESGDLTTLKLLPQQYPQGQWRSRAEGIIGIAEQQQKQQVRLKKKAKELAETQQEKEVLFQDNVILEVTLERLKQVLIDMEQRKE